MGDNRIPVLKPDLKLAAPTEPQPEADAAARKLYDEATPGVVKIETDSGSGTGFFVDDKGTLVTAAHVVLGSKEHFARMKDGTRYKLMIERMDDINDTAVLRPIGMGKVPYYFQMGETKDLKPDQVLYALGHPQGLRPAYISPGYFKEPSTPLDLMTDANPMAIMQLEAALSSMTPKEQADAKSMLERPLVHNYLHIEPGNSGGPMVDANHKVIGLSDMIKRDNASESYFVPAEQIKAVIDPSFDKFRFTYSRAPEAWAQKYIGMWHNSPETAIATTGTAGILGYGGMRVLSRNPRLGGAFAGVVGLSSLSTDGSNLLNSTDSRDTLKYGLASAADATTILGGVASFIPRARTLGLVAIGVGMAGRVATDFIGNRLVLSDISRSDGDVRPPMDPSGLSFQSIGRNPVWRH